MNRPAATAVIGASLTAALAVTGAGIVQASPATASHTLHFTSRELRTTPLGKTEMAEVDRDFAASKTLGFNATHCTFDFTTGVAHCNLAAAFKGGMLYGKIAVNGMQGTGKGTVTGGTGAYKGARGTVTSQPTSRKSDTKVTIVYHS